jgi:hypothetical protein
VSGQTQQTREQPHNNLICLKWKRKFVAFFSS